MSPTTRNVVNTRPYLFSFIFTINLRLFLPQLHVFITFVARLVVCKEVFGADLNAIFISLFAYLIICDTRHRLMTQ